MKEKPIGNTMKVTTTFTGSFAGGKKYIIPVGKVDDRGNLVIDTESKITVDGKPTDGIKHKTTKQYFFEEKPNEDAIELCSGYFQKLKNIVKECYTNFQPYKNQAHKHHSAYLSLKVNHVCLILLF